MAEIRTVTTLSTKALAERAMKASGLDATDKVLAKAVAYKIVMAMRQQHIRGKVQDAGRVKGARVWALSPSAVAQCVGHADA